MMGLYLLARWLQWKDRVLGWLDGRPSRGAAPAAESRMADQRLLT